MLPKVVGYGGFQSYSQMPYPHLKPGKEQKNEHTKYSKSLSKNFIPFYNPFRQLWES